MTNSWIDMKGILVKCKKVIPTIKDKWMNYLDHLIKTIWLDSAKDSGKSQALVIK